MWSTVTRFVMGFLGNKLVLWGGGAVLVAVATWWGGNAIKTTLQKANDYDDVVAQLAFTKEIHEEELRVLKAEHAATIKAEQEARLTAEENAAAADERREHWRQSWYRKQNEFKEYKQETQDWIGVPYPAELDGLHEQATE